MNTIIINGEEWEVVDKDEKESEEYEYQDYYKSNLELKNKFSYKALSNLINAGIKTNIHFIFSKLSAELACRLLQGDDIFNGNVDLEKLNAIVFLLFKPQGRGKHLDWSPTQDQIDVFAELIKSPETKFKIGMDSCLINKVAQ